MGLVLGVSLCAGIGPRGIHEAHHRHIALRPHLEATRGSQMMPGHPHAVGHTAILSYEPNLSSPSGERHGDHGAVERAILFYERHPRAQPGDERFGAHAPRGLRWRHAALDVAIDIQLAQGLALATDHILIQEPADVILYLGLVLFADERKILCQLLCDQKELVDTILRLRHRWLSPCPRGAQAAVFIGL